MRSACNYAYGETPSLLDTVNVVMEHVCCDRKAGRKGRGMNGGRGEKRGQKGKQRRRKDKGREEKEMNEWRKERKARTKRNTTKMERQRTGGKEEE